MLKLIKLIISRNKSYEHYVEMQHYFAEATIFQLNSKGINLSELKVIELAAGHGGYSQILNENSKEFIATDKYKAKIFKDTNIPFLKMDVLQPFPLDSNSFNLIYCSSLIEHLSNPIPMLKEALRVLKPGGILYLSFPPFYSLFMVGGHVFKPFHFLGEKIAVKSCNLLKRRPYKLEGYFSYPQNCGLYPLKIDQVTKLLLENGFEIQDIYTRMTKINTAHLPGILKDLLTWHVCYLSKKPS